MAHKIMRNRFLNVLFISVVATTVACGGGDGGSSNRNSASKPFNLSCNLKGNYTARSAALSFPSTAVGAAIATAIVVHGKNGVPTAAHMIGLKDKLNGLGYDVIMPYMTWSTLRWDGSLCDSMLTVNNLVKIEKDAGRSVILVGHSLGGPAVLAFAALQNTTKPDVTVIVAPGHFIHFSFLLEATHGPSISKAKSLISMGRGNQVNTFITLNGGIEITITLTPENYLSMHDTNQFPNFKSSAALVAVPLLWIAGTQDNLTAIATNFGLRSGISNKQAFLYQELTGTHLTVLSVPSAGAIDAWYRGL